MSKKQRKRSVVKARNKGKVTSALAKPGETPIVTSTPRRKVK